MRSGEWGGFFKEGDMERRWAEAFVDYLLTIGATDQFFWCMNPNSGKALVLSLKLAVGSDYAAPLKIWIHSIYFLDSIDSIPDCLACIVMLCFVCR